MIVTFDSNTWRMVASPDNFPSNPQIEYYRKIRENINSGRIQAFLSETIFTLEAIKKLDRKAFIRDYKADFKTEIVELPDGQVKIEFRMGPNENAHPGNNDFLKEHLKDAVSLGFKILYLPRIAGIKNPEIEAYLYKQQGAQLKAYLDKVFEVARKIEELECGNFAVKEIGLKYHPEAVFIGLGLAPDSENGNIAKAVAEWADGDSIACHIAIGGDYFCTNDQSKSGGQKSVFSAANLAQLKTLYGLTVVKPEELCTYL